ncbi:hypothetical protein ACF3MZ_31410 [Paenibacillaceae bacterium WGS1546]|uniref:hypothetical protein n=1 Tax=Cohnella sp. WGS1546 TaxID=3366810 RepID=UPI00372D4FB3
MKKKQVWKWLLPAALVVMILAAGCSKAEQAIKEAEQGTTTITKEDGEEIKLSGKPDIPDLFPSDVPLPDGIQVTSSISSNDSVTLTIETEMPYEEVLELYYDYSQQAGYSEVHRLESENTIHYSAQKGTERFVFSLQLDLEDNKTVTGALVYSNIPENEQQ